MNNNSQHKEDDTSSNITEKPIIKTFHKNRIQAQNITQKLMTYTNKVFGEDKIQEKNQRVEEEKRKVMKKYSQIDEIYCTFNAKNGLSLQQSNVLPKNKIIMESIIQNLNNITSEVK